MEVARRNYILCALMLNFLTVVFIIVAYSGDWVSSSSLDTGARFHNGSFNYGLFNGWIDRRTFSFPVWTKLHMVCVPDVNACAVSCKSNSLAREREVRAMAAGLRPDPYCGVNVTTDPGDDSDPIPVISYTFYVWMLLILSLQLVYSVIAAGLTFYNYRKVPRNSILGTYGCICFNKAAAMMGLAVLIMFGVNWETSDLKNHAAMSFIAQEVFTANPSLSFSYWFLLPAVIFSLASATLLRIRKIKLEREPAPPPIKHPLPESDIKWNKMKN